MNIKFWRKQLHEEEVEGNIIIVMVVMKEQ